MNIVLSNQGVELSDNVDCSKSAVGAGQMQRTNSSERKASD